MGGCPIIPKEQQQKLHCFHCSAAGSTAKLSFIDQLPLISQCICVQQLSNSCTHMRHKLFDWQMSIASFRVEFEGGLAM